MSQLDFLTDNKFRDYIDSFKSTYSLETGSPEPFSANAGNLRNLLLEIENELASQSQGIFHGASTIIDDVPAQDILDAKFKAFYFFFNIQEIGDILLRTYGLAFKQYVGKNMFNICAALLAFNHLYFFLKNQPLNIGPVELEPFKINEYDKNQLLMALICEYCGVDYRAFYRFVNVLASERSQKMLGVYSKMTTQNLSLDYPRIMCTKALSTIAHIANLIVVPTTENHPVGEP